MNWTTDAARLLCNYWILAIGDGVVPRYFLPLLFLTLPAFAAEPDRDALIEAWVDYMPTTIGTVAFERRAEDVFYLEDENLPYSGEVRLIGALVRSTEAFSEPNAYSHIGTLEFELTDLPVERLQSQNYYYWLADRQTLYFSRDEQAWVDPQTYRIEIQEFYSPTVSFGVLSFMLNYGIWVLLIALLIWVYAMLNKHNRKARALMDDSMSINEMARENIERSEKIQRESIEITRQMLAIQKENVELLKEIRDRLG